MRRLSHDVTNAAVGVLKDVSSMFRLYNKINYY